MIKEKALASPQGTAFNEVVSFNGHPMVRSTHPTTIEVTTEEHLTESGDCIIGVAADKGCAQLDQRLKEGLRRNGARVSIRIIVGSLSYCVEARGDSRLELTHPRDMVIRKSDFMSGRTLAVNANAAAKDIPREIVRRLRDPGTVGRLQIEVT